MTVAAILPLSAHPRHAPLVARRRVEAFHDDSLTVADMTALILAPPPPDLPGETVLPLDGGVPAATASLVRRDLDSRPDLPPWLAGVPVRPESRGHGHATILVRHAEAHAAAARLARPPLHSSMAEPLHARLGWTPAGPERRLRTRAAVVPMARNLNPAAAAAGEAGRCTS